MPIKLHKEDTYHRLLGHSFWQTPWENISGMLKSFQEVLLRTVFALTEWFSLPLLIEILDEVNVRGFEETLGRNSEKALLGILGLLEERLRQKRLKLPDEVLMGISEKFQMTISRKNVISYYARYRKSKSLLATWDTLRLKVYEYYSPLKHLDPNGMILENSLFIVELLEVTRSWYLSPDAYARGILELQYQTMYGKPGEVLFLGDKETQKAKAKLKVKFKQKIPRLRPWMPFELELIQDLYESGASIQEIHRSFSTKKLRRSFNQLSAKVMLMGIHGSINSSKRHQNLVDEALLSDA